MPSRSALLSSVTCSVAVSSATSAGVRNPSRSASYARVVFSIAALRSRSASAAARAVERFRLRDQLRLQRGRKFRQRTLRGLVAQPRCFAGTGLADFDLTQQRDLATQRHQFPFGVLARTLGVGRLRLRRTRSLRCLELLVDLRATPALVGTPRGCLRQS